MTAVCMPGLKKQNKHFTYYLNLNESENAINYLIQNPKYICWDILSANQYAIDLLMKNPEEIHWPSFCKNPAAMDIILKNPDKIHWESLSTNPSAIDFLKKNKNKINYSYLIYNDNAFELIKEYIETNYERMKSLNIIDKTPYFKTYIQSLCENKNEHLIQYLYKNYFECLCWEKLNTNPGAIDILLENMDKIKINYLSYNPHPKAQEIVKKNPRKIDWQAFSIHVTDYAFIVENNPILHEYFWANPLIFDYKTISKYYMDIIKEELMMKVFHPSKIEKWLEQGYDIDDL